MDEITDSNSETTNNDVTPYLPGSKRQTINPNAPDFVKELIEKNKTPIDVNVGYDLPNSYVTVYPGGFTSSPSLEGKTEKPSFISTFKAQAYNMNYTAQGLNVIDDLWDAHNPLLDVKEDGWTPTSDADSFINVRDEYMPALLNAKSRRQQQLLLNKIYEEQKRADDVHNGSWLAWLLGGAFGMITDPMTYIPIAGWVKYAKISSSFFKSAMKAVPGGGAYGVLSAGAEQLDKVNGNVHDFVVDSFVRTAFSTVLFGGLGAASSLTERLSLWELRNLTKAHVDGIDFKFKLNEKGEIDGYKMIDQSGGNLSAAKLSYYQDMADSTFYRSGVFKIPYVGEGIIKLAGMPVFGSPLINLINSKSQVVRAVIDRVADHNFFTKGLEEGKEAPQKFASLMNQENQKLLSIGVQYDSLFHEVNGINIKNRIGANAVEKALYLKNKSAELFSQKANKENYMSREEFNDKVQEVLYSTKPSERSEVNQAAALIREQKDTVYKNLRKAYDLPEDWLPPLTADGFLSRVYDTPYMNLNRGKWEDVIANWLKEADDIITQRMEPIKTVTKQIEQNIAEQEVLLTRPNATNKQKKQYADELLALRAKKKALEENLQNEIRENPDFVLHAEDYNALSANEAKELIQLTKKRDTVEKQVDELKSIISKMKTEMNLFSKTALKNKTVETAKNNKKKSEMAQQKLKQEEEKLNILEKELEEERFNLQELAHSGKMNKRFFKKERGAEFVVFKNPNERLRFREVYQEGSLEDPNFFRKQHAKAYYDTILNQTPEDTINQTMGRLTGNGRENPLKARTLLLPDKLLYDNKFLTNDVMAKTWNYSTYLARRTHLKNVFNDVTIDGGFEPVVAELGKEFEREHISLSQRKTELENKITNENLSLKEKRSEEKKLKKVDKDLSKLRNQFDKNKDVLNHLYDKMMGIQKTSRNAQKIKASVMSITAWVNLPFVPLTQVNDLSAIGLQHGMFAFIRDGLYPVIESLGGILKTKDSEALRKTAPSIHLALQDRMMGYAERNWSRQTNPYLNLGRFVNSLQKIAQFSSNFTGTNYIDNGLQHITGAVAQGELMRIMHDFQKGTLSKRDYRYALKYGIDPKVWSERMTEAFKKNGGGKTKLGGYQSHFWQWEDMEAANKFSSAVFRSVKDTQIQAGIIDAPLWTDDNGPIGIMGSFLRGFNGWAFASINRYVIPSLQAADGEKLIGVLFMLGTGYLVDPMRRIARGEEIFPESMSEKEILWATINNSGYFSWFANVLANANLISGGNLMGNLRSDKYKNRTRAGLLGPTWGTVNRMIDIIDALSSNEMNEADAKKMARMIPGANASWTTLMSQYIVESLGLPKTRRQAKASKEE